MRRRRAERLLLRAEAAADAGCLDDARMCLAEARALAPDLAGLDGLDQRLSPAASVEPPTGRSRTALAVVVMAALIAGLILVGRPMISRFDLPIESRRMAQTTVPAAVPEPAVPTQPASPASIPNTSVPAAGVPAAGVPDTNVPRPDVATIPAAQARIEAPVDKPEKPAEPQPAPRDVPATVKDPADALPRVSRVDPLPSAESTPGRVTGPPPASLDAAPVGVAIPIPTGPPPVVRPTAEPSQEPVVRSVLDRYASAYSALDVDAAQRVWPGVNRGALSRAFEGLESQEISLGTCRINVAGATATAQCSGTASWSPKIGGGSRSEARHWTFELSRASSGWEIVTARVQNR